VEVGLAAAGGDSPGPASVGGDDESDRRGKVDADTRVSGGVVGAVGSDGEAHEVDDWSGLYELAVVLSDESLVGG